MPMGWVVVIIPAGRRGFIELRAWAGVFLFNCLRARKARRRTEGEVGQEDARAAQRRLTENNVSEVLWKQSRPIPER